MQRARTPNAGFFVTGRCLPPGRSGEVQVRGSDIRSSWVDSDAELVALHKWIDLRQFIRAVDAPTRTVYAVRYDSDEHQGARRALLCGNTLDAVDEPGEWYLERTTGLITCMATPAKTWPRRRRRLNKKF